MVEIAFGGEGFGRGICRDSGCRSRRRVRDFHPLTLGGYALVLQAVYEFPVDVGATVYANIEDLLHIEHEFTLLGGELRTEFMGTRDEEQSMVADELELGLCGGCEAWCTR